MDKRKRDNTARLESIEPRILFSADFSPVLLDAPDAGNAAETRSIDDAGEFEVAPGSVESAKRTEIVIVDGNVENADRLIDDLRESAGSDRQVEFVFLDADRDGIAQVSEALASRADVAAVHLISHGDEGRVQLGNSVLDFDALLASASQIKAWGQSLSQDADIMIYGCDVAASEGGRSLIDALSRLTGADVAGSDDTTGNTVLGGDWDLEYRVGLIEAMPVFDANQSVAWSGLLAVSSNGTVTSASTDGATNLSWSHTVSAGTNRVLVVELAIDELAANVTSVTYGGVAMTQIGRGAGNHAVELWALVDPAVGTANVVAAFSSPTAAAGGAAAYNGVNQNNPFGTFVSATGTGTTASVTVTSASGDQVIDVQYWDGNPSGGAPGAGQTLRWWQIGGAMIGGGTVEAGAPSVVMSGDFFTSTQWEIGAVSMRAAPVVNTAPALSGLGGSVSYTENGALVVLDAYVTIADGQLSADDNFSGATLTLMRNGGAAVQDVFSATGTLGTLTQGATLVVGGTGIGTVTTNSGGALVLTFNAGATNALVNEAIQQIAYGNTSDAPPPSVQIDWTFSDGNTGAQGSGGALTAAGSSTVAITGVNDAPVDLYGVPGVAHQNLIAVYGFDASGALGQDDSGSGAAITLYGNPTQVSGPAGSGALALSGGQYGDISGISTGGAMTFAASVRFDSTGDWQRVFDFGQPVSAGIGNVYVARLAGTSDLTFTIEKTDGTPYTYRATAPGAITNGNWLHFAATVDGAGNMSLYVDGALAGTESGVPLEVGVRTNNYIGRSHWGGDAPFEGAIDDMVIVNGAMSASEIAAMYQQNAGFTVSENAANGAVIGSVVGSDLDESDTRTFSLSGSAGGRFAIHATSGTITVADGSLLDYETASAHSVTVRVTDSGGLWYEEVFAVNLTDANDAPTGVPTIGGTPTENQTLTAVTAGIADADGLGAFSFQWLRDGMAIGGATSSVYTLAAADIGTSISVTVSYTDGNGANESLTSSAVGPVADVNDAPVLVGSAGSVQYNENSVPVALDGALSVSDVDSATLIGATVSIGVAFSSGEDVLAFTNQLGIAGSWDGATGILTLSGTASVADYEAALRSVTYVNTSDDPSIDARTVAFVVSDGALDSAPVTRQVQVVAWNDPPQSDDVSASGFEDATSIPVTLAGSDLDGTVDRFRLTTLPDNGALYLDVGLTVVAATGVDYTASGEALGLYFVPAEDWNGSTSFGYVAGSSDGGLDTTAATASIAVDAVNDLPVIDLDADDSAGVGASDYEIQFVEGGGPVLIIDSDASLIDVDSASLTGLTVSIDNLIDPGHEFLTVDVSETAIVAAFDANSGVLTLSGLDSTANYEQVLRTIRYENTSDTPDGTDRQLWLRADDNSLGYSNDALATIHVVASGPPGDPPATGGPPTEDQAPTPSVLSLPSAPRGAPVAPPAAVEELDATVATPTESSASESIRAEEPTPDDALQDDNQGEGEVGDGRLGGSGGNAGARFDGTVRQGQAIPPMVRLNGFAHIDRTPVHVREVEGEQLGNDDFLLQLATDFGAAGRFVPSTPTGWQAQSMFEDGQDDPVQQELEVLIDSVKFGGLALSVGAVWWASRLSGLVGSMLASAPAWRHMDPLPVLGQGDDEGEESWYDAGDKDADANELAISLVLEGGDTPRSQRGPR